MGSVLEGVERQVYQRRPQDNITVIINHTSEARDHDGLVLRG